jgi:hypothetical protein
MGKFIKNYDNLQTQIERADDTDWAAHAAGELAGTHDYTEIAKVRPVAPKRSAESKFVLLQLSPYQPREATWARCLPEIASQQL